MRRRLAKDETIQDLESAARARLFDAQALEAAGRAGGAIYLAGYVAEITLKAACFRLGGHTPSTLVQPLLFTYKNRGVLTLPAVPYESGHSLPFWALMLEADHRRTKGRVREAVKRSVQEAKKMHAKWGPQLRYRDEIASADDAKKMVQRAAWFRALGSELWR